MENRNLYKLRIIWSIRYRSIIGTGLLLVMLVASVVSPGTTTVLADAGDYSIDWVAANPYSYDHLTGGGAYDDRTIGLELNGDVVKSLEGADFACGDIVTYLAYITIDDPTSTETIELTTRFSANTTGQPGAGHVDIVNVAVNYGSIAQWDVDGDTIPDVIGDGLNEWDAGIIDDSGSTATITSKTFDPLLADGGGSIIDNPDTKADLVGVITINDLEADDTSIVVRVDVQVDCTIPSGPTGNLQASLSSARVIEGVTGTISGGEQTIPFKGLSQILFPGLNLFKSVSLDGTCPGEETLTVPVGTTVYYCFRIHNNGDADLYDITLEDNMLGGDIIGLLGGFDDLGGGPEPDLESERFADNYGTYLGYPPLAHVANQDITNIATASGSGLTDTASCTVTVYSADFGDLPGDYKLTTLEDDGARHEIGDLWLGDKIDHESDGQESANAGGDGDDEDGVFLPAGFNWSDGEGELTVIVSSTVSTEGDVGCLTGWLDFTDGIALTGESNYVFTDTYQTYNELIIDNQLVSTGTNQVTFDLPVGAADGGLFYGRFRLVPALQDGVCGEAPGLTGFWENGEVEDYLFIFGPNAVTLTEFDASSNSGVRTGWFYILALLSFGALAAGLLWSRLRSRLDH